VILAIAKLVGALGVLEVAVFLLVLLSVGLASLLPNRLQFWSLTRLAVVLVCTMAPNLPSRWLIAWSRGLNLKGVVVGSLAIVTAAAALAPSDPPTMLFAYVPLQFILLGYAFIRRAPEKSENDQE